MRRWWPGRTTVSGRRPTRRPMPSSWPCERHRASSASSVSPTPIFTTHEPCAMCVGALLESDVEALVFAMPNSVDGAAGTVLQLAQHPALPRRIKVVSGIRRDEAERLLAPSGVRWPLWYPLGRRGVRVVDGAALRGLRKQRGFESHPLRQTHRSPGTGRRQRPVLVRRGRGRLWRTMAPHWKCGPGQPVAGSNPALLAITRADLNADRGVAACAAPLTHIRVRARVAARRRLALGAHLGALTFHGEALEITPIEYGTFRFPDPALAGRRGGGRVRHSASRWRVPVRYRGLPNAELEETHYPEARRVEEALAGAGLAIDDVTAIANCHLHADHAGQISPSLACRSTCRPRSGSCSTRPTTRSSSGSISRVRRTSR